MVLVVSIVAILIDSLTSRDKLCQFDVKKADKKRKPKKKKSKKHTSKKAKKRDRGRKAKPKGRAAGKNPKRRKVIHSLDFSIWLM